MILWHMDHGLILWIDSLGYVALVPSPLRPSGPLSFNYKAVYDSISNKQLSTIVITDMFS